MAADAGRARRPPRRRGGELTPGTGTSDPDRLLADVGALLAERVAAAVPGWVVRCVDGVLPAGAPDRRAVLAQAEAAGHRAGDEVGDALRALLGADVDSQHSTPLAVLRAAADHPTAVLRAAGVPPVERDRFAQERFPSDVYALTPASLAAVDPALAEPAIAWGAAKAMAHRRRHGDARPDHGS